MDTNIIPGFRNELCLSPNLLSDTGCDDVVPTTGGIVSITFNKTNDGLQSSVGTFVEKIFGVITVNTTAAKYFFTGNAVGTVIAANVKNGASLELLTFASGKVGQKTVLKLASKSLDPKVLLQLQQIRGRQ